MSRSASKYLSAQFISTQSRWKISSAAEVGCNLPGAGCAIRGAVDKATSSPAINFIIARNNARTTRAFSRDKLPLELSGEPSAAMPTCTARRTRMTVAGLAFFFIHESRERWLKREADHGTETRRIAPNSEGPVRLVHRRRVDRTVEQPAGAVADRGCLGKLPARRQDRLAQPPARPDADRDFRHRVDPVRRRGAGRNPRRRRDLVSAQP